MAWRGLNCAMLFFEPNSYTFTQDLNDIAHGSER